MFTGTLCAEVSEVLNYALPCVCSRFVPRPPQAGSPQHVPQKNLQYSMSAIAEP